MKFIKLNQNDSDYPASLCKYLDDRTLGTISALGNINILKNKKLAFFCSVKCPGHFILKTHDLSQSLKQAGVTVIGGFHSPIERECLRILLRGQQPIILCPARGLKGMRLRAEHKKPIEEGRLLLLSPFIERQRRNTAETALERNRFAAALADTIFVAHASPNSKTEMFCRELLAWGKPLYTLESDANANLIKLGAKPMNIKRNLDEWGHFLEKN